LNFTGYSFGGSLALGFEAAPDTFERLPPCALKNEDKVKAKETEIRVCKVPKEKKLFFVIADDELCVCV